MFRVVTTGGGWVLLAPSVWKPEMLLNISRAAPRPTTVKNHLAQTVSADAKVSEDLGPVVPSNQSSVLPKEKEARVLSGDGYCSQPKAVPRP